MWEEHERKTLPHDQLFGSIRAGKVQWLWMKQQDGSVCVSSVACLLQRRKCFVPMA